ncbi:OprD family outer membrane porin [uncultured Desulfuromonas sp.]|uniref:OprD family outer membrane porin n=1 Tax=uncultured Desulfuromonas sp. TaxID=181013 RepID=UPI002AAA7569|nr:OprD family outer membrane porin [uncultured Desulfuromonas sp.]
MRKMVVCLLLLCLSTPAMAADNLKEMFANGTFKGEIQLLQFTRHFDRTTTDRQDRALGGSFYYKTDSFKGINLGVAFASTNNLDSDDDKGTYGLLAAGHESVTRLQEYYVQFHYFDTTVKVGAQEVYTPFLFPHPFRMMPRAFRGVSAVNQSFDNLKLMAFYLKSAVDWDDKTFGDISKAINPQIDSEDVYIIGASYNVPVEGMKVNVQGWGFSMTDVFNQTYFSAAASKKMDNDMVLHGGAKFFTQNSQGDERNGDLDTYQYGVNAGLAAFGFDLTAFYSKTGDDGIVDRWGYNKAIIQQVWHTGILADEDAYAAKLSYDFANVGAQGLSAYVFHTEYDTHDSNLNDKAETDLSVQYAFSGDYKGLGLRARYAMINTKGGGEDFTDTRFYITYKF